MYAISPSRSRNVLAIVVALALSASVTSSGVWEEKTGLPRPRGSLGLVAVDGVMYAVAGGRVLHCFTPDCYAREVAAYDPSTDTWQDRAIGTIRKNHATVAVGGLVYVMGGDNDFTIFNSVEAYNPAADSWSSRAPMPTARTILAAGEIDGIIYAVGGGTTPATQNEAYNPLTNTWSVKAPMPVPRYGFTAIGYQGKLWTIGGTDPHTGLVFATVYAYDPDTDTWSAMPSLPSPRSAAAAAVHDGKLYVLGGFTPGIGSLASVSIYDPDTSSWSDGPPLSVHRHSLGAAVLDDVIYAVGGIQAMPTGHATGIMKTVEALEAADTTPPTIANVTPNPAVLWPPNHKMTDVAIVVAASDDEDPGPVCIISDVMSSEPSNGTGDGDTAPDVGPVNGLSVSLRAERAGSGSGRDYTITVTCADASSNTASASTVVTVPHSLRR